MTPFMFWVATIILVASLSFYASHGSFKEVLRFFREEGKNSWKDIKLFIGVILLIGIAILAFVPVKSKADEYNITYLNYVEIWAGVAYTKETSPFCYEQGPDKKATSDGGIRLNLLSVSNKNLVFDLNGKFTHHSCSQNDDRPTFDGVGPEATLRLNF